MTSTPTNDRLLRAAKGEHTGRPPVWLMRQAGRFDPQYQKIRAGCGLELETLFAHPELAAKITQLPLRFGVDAAILFQDILTITGPMGAPFVFRPGPTLEQPLRTTDDVRRLTGYDVRDGMGFVAESIGLAIQGIGGAVPLLGFAGSPVTVAAFLLAGGSPDAGLTALRALHKTDPAAMKNLLALLSDITAEYLEMQIDAGVHAVQLFESVADRLTTEEYQTLAVPAQQRSLQRAKGRIPTILFAKERPELELLHASGADVLSVGTCVDLAHAKQSLGRGYAMQGNVDNELLRAGPTDAIARAVRECCAAGGATGHILNLNHGVFKDTPVHHVRTLIDTCRAFEHDAGTNTGA